jgi:bifunctional NMN adenylyltransferase/nudix hydrolase
MNDIELYNSLPKNTYEEHMSRLDGALTHKYDLLVFIGRFQPLHLGHQEVIDRARKLATNVLVLVGSAGVARSVRNPFTYEERREVIKNLYPEVHVLPIHDHTYNDNAWIVEVQDRVRQHITGRKKWSPDGLADYKIGLIGCEKDHTSYYLKMFPDWGSENVHFVTPLNATAIREKLYSADFWQRYEAAAIMDPKTYDWLVEHRHTPEFAKLRMEYEYLVDYKKKYGEGPFLTADSLVQVGGKILLIRRGKEYGQGLLAMPGGFVNKNETFKNAALRELKEETNLRVPRPVLQGSIRDHRVFDDPHRSSRARLVTECFHFQLVNDTKLPEVRGGDDADHADWYDIGALQQEDFFEDHYHIIKAMLGLN